MRITKKNVIDAIDSVTAFLKNQDAKLNDLDCCLQDCESEHNSRFELRYDRLCSMRAECDRLCIAIREAKDKLHDALEELETTVDNVER